MAGRLTVLPHHARTAPAALVQSALRRRPRWLSPGGGRASPEQTPVTGLYLRGTVATVAAFLLAQPLHDPSPPVTAALTALLVVQVTLTSTVKNGLQRVAAVVLGVLLAHAIGFAVGFVWWSLGLVVLGSLFVGQLLRLGPSVAEAPISAMLILSVQGEPGATSVRITETLVGAATGILVNLLLVPPVHLAPAARGLSNVTGQLNELLLMMGYGLASRCDDQQTREWLATARRMQPPLAATRGLIEQAEESARWNLRGRRSDASLRALHRSYSALEQATLALRGVCRQLVERPPVQPEDAFDPPAREALSELLLHMADAASAFGALLLPGGEGDPAELLTTHAIARIRAIDAHTRLATELATDTQRGAAVWQADGSLLALLTQLLSDLDPPELRRLQPA
ncbi:MAG: hypothetical protein JWM67_2913 [Mycobacterium sp.]|nr:hypothetical protein [Mycobacterium sp.]